MRGDSSFKYHRTCVTSQAVSQVWIFILRFGYRRVLQGPELENGNSYSPKYGSVVLAGNCMRLAT